MTTAILWFKNDLRLHDHPALLRAASSNHLLPIYIADPRQWRLNDLGLPKSGPFRFRFLQESLADLQESLLQLGSDLRIVNGFPEEILPELFRRYPDAELFAHLDPGTEEATVREALANLLPAGRVHFLEGNQLYEAAELPFARTELPDVFTDFRKRVEKSAIVASPLATPAALPPLPPSPPASQEMAGPGFLEWAGTADQPDDVFHFRGGEKAALQRLAYYLWQSDLVCTYKETRNGLLGEDYSTKFSPWLALGCLSPRIIVHEIRRYEATVKANSSTYWVIFELLWREYFRLVLWQFGKKVFLPGGIRDQAPGFREDSAAFQRWRNGETGVPFIDANMRELNQTGFMSNRGRQNVASYLVKDLSLDWRLGAQYFESLLIDYDVASNWGNWCYIAGVGNDPREDRYFNILGQARRYDPKGRYVRFWIPALRKLPPEKIHTPFFMDPPQLRAYGIEAGKDYPQLRVIPRSWEKKPRR
ncbi:MAG TPA: DASH family cryptochrome [Calditrichia bacterium]|nr:DASH family cryptochrome [Calditrichia bacterium]